jgi:hypothetical protein
MLLLKTIPVIFILKYTPVWIDGMILPGTIAENPRKERMNAKFIVVAEGMINPCETVYSNSLTD